MGSPLLGMQYEPPAAASPLIGTGYDDVPEAPEISPLKTVGLNAVNLFGAAPAAYGAVSSLTGNGDYAAKRDELQQEIDAANEQNPKAALVGKGVSLLGETALGGAAGKVIGLGAKAAGLGAKLAEASPLTQSVVKGALGGAGYGAASGAGEALSHGQDVLPATLEGAGAGAATGGVLGGVFHGAGKLLEGAPAREEADLLQGVASGEGEAGGATPKVKKLLANKQRDVIDTLREDPALLKASRMPARDAAPIFRGKLEELGSKLDPLYKHIDEAGGGVSVNGLVEHLDGEIAQLAKEPLNEVYTQGIAKIRDSLLDAWAPQAKAAQATIRDLQAQGISKIPPSLLPPDVYVPTQKLRAVVTQLQTRATDVINGLNPGESSKAKAEFASLLKDYLDQHIDASALTDKTADAAAKQIRDINKRYSAVATMLKAIDQRAWKEQTGSISGAGIASQLLRKGSILGAGVQAIHGHPVAALATLAGHQVIEHIPAATRFANERLASLARAADAGNPNALRLMQRLRFGAQVGQAGAAAAGTAVTTNLAQQDASQ